MADRLRDQMTRATGRVHDVLESISSSQRNRRLLAGVADITQVLLAEDDLDAAIAYALRRSRLLAEADEVEIGRLHHVDGRDLLEPWAADPPFDNPTMRIDLAAVGASSWLARFHRGEAVRASAEDLAGAARELLERYGSSSILFLPIPGTRGAWGVVGFSSEDASRVWSEQEEALLSALAASLGAALWRREAARQELEEQRRALDERREAGLLLMARGVAHDFGNVVQVLEGAVEIARRRGADSPELATAQRAVERANGLAQQLRLIAGLEPPHKRAVALDDLVEQSLALVSDVRGSCEISTAVASDLPPLVGDPTQLGQVLTNLLRNACEACGGSAGKIRLEIERAERTVDGESRIQTGTLIRIRDDGPGIEPQHEERLLEPFYSTRGDGRGLGLALAYAIVGAHEGQLSIGNAPNGGTEVEAWLPSGQSVGQPLAARSR